MKAMHMRRLAAAVLAATLLFALAAPAVAASTTMVATGNVNIRSGPGTNYSSLGILSKGKTIVKTGSSGQWAKVLYDNKTAYIMGSYLKTYSGSATPTPVISILPTPTPTPSNSLLYALVSTAIRKGPGTSYMAIGYLDPGDSVTSLGTVTSGYYQVQLGGNTGYVPVSDVSTQSPSIYGTVYALSTVTVYSGTTTSTAAIGYLTQGQTATRTGVVGSLWTQIVFNGQTGYVLTSQIANWSSGTSAANGTVYASSTVPVYNSPSATTTIGYLTQGQSAVSAGTTGIWTQIVFNGQTGYVLTSQVTASTGGTPAGFTALGRTMYALSSQVYCYSSPYELSSYAVGYLSLNESVWGIATNGTWIQAYVQSQTQPLYIPASKLGYTAGTGTGTGVQYVQQYTGAPTYSDMSGTAFLYTYRPAGSDVNETVASIDRGVAVNVLSSSGTWAYVSWAGRDGATKTAYVKANRLGPTIPQ